MVTDDDIRRQLVNALGKLPETVLAEVKSVDTTARTCDIDNDGVLMYGIRLQAIVQGNTGLVLYPAIGSQVVCCRIEDTEQYMVLHASDIDQAQLTIGDKSVKMDKNGFTFNDGTVGAVCADKLVEWMSKVYSDLQTLITLLSTSPVAGNGAPLGVVFTPATPSPNLADFTDDAFKH